MIEKAAADRDIDVAASFVVGDKWLDIELAQRAGAAGVLVRTGYGQSAEAERPAGIHPVPVVDTLLDAAVLDSGAVVARVVQELIWRGLLHCRARPRSVCSR